MAWRFPQRPLQRMSGPVPGRGSKAMAPPKLVSQQHIPSLAVLDNTNSEPLPAAHKITIRPPSVTTAVGWELICCVRVSTDVLLTEGSCARRPGPARRGAPRGPARWPGRSVTPLWIQDAVSFSAQPDLIRAVATRPEIASIAAEQTVVAPPPPAGGNGSGVEPNEQIIITYCS